ncbi:MAG: ScyD/ScyE family protein [Anaerolineae bacterium]|nr:MAG: ScyD/ScyE family protein [Anaerolineae bacterium]
MYRRISLIGVLCLALIFIAANALPTAAQDGPQSLVSGLNSPRALYVADDGTVYVVEAGMGGTTPTGMTGPSGLEALSGATGRVSTLAEDGTLTPVLSDLPSVDLGGSETAGPTAVAVTESSLWVMFNGGPMSHPLYFSLVELDAATHRIKTSIDLFSYEATENPDGKEVDCNPIDFAIAEDGTIYIVDAGGNDILTWTAEDGLQTLMVWENNDVPTSIDLGPDGNLYISFLTPFPFPEGGARIDVISPDGDLVKQYTGLTLAVNVAVTDDGAIYAVEFGRFDLSIADADTSPWVPNSGRVVMVSDDGVTPVAEGLNFPYALAQDADGNWLVTNSSAYSEPGSGEVLLIEAGM